MAVALAMVIAVITVVMARCLTQPFADEGTARGAEGNAKLAKHRLHLRIARREDVFA